MSETAAAAEENRRQVLYWRLLARVFQADEQPTLESASFAIVDDLGLPVALLDPSVSVDTVVQRFPELADELRGLMAPPPDASTAGTDADVVLSPDGSGLAGSGPAASGAAASADGASAPDQVGAETAVDSVAPDGASPVVEPTGSAGLVDAGSVDAGSVDAGSVDAGSVDADPRSQRAGRDEVRRAALVSKLLLNVFATGSGNVTAGQLARWQSDAAWFEQALGCKPGELRGRAAGAGVGGTGAGGRGTGLGSGPGSGVGNGPGSGFGVDLDKGLAGILAGLEGDLVRRMQLREVLADPALAKQLTPSMSLIEQLLRDKDNLSGVALANAKALIRRFVDEVAEVLRTQVQQTTVGTIDRSIPPKRVFRNLDIERTIWKNLTNWSPEDERLYVDRLFYRHTAKRTTPARLIVVVDQSGSMVDAMVNCTILASIFAGLPKVDVHLVAYDTRALDLTPWVHDPFEVLLRTQLGGGTDGLSALNLARPKIVDPRNSVVVWISDFYEWQEQAVFEGMTAIHRSGAKFIPVGSVNSGGQQSVNPWFRQRFKDMGTPVLSGHIRKLVTELKNFLT